MYHFYQLPVFKDVIYYKYTIYDKVNQNMYIQ